MTSPPDTRDDWIPVGTCTLAPAEQPRRRDEFDALFAEFLTAIEVVTSSRVLLTLTGGAEVAARARTLVRLETDCCSFFTFGVTEDADRVLLDISVPGARADVLGALVGRAHRARGGA